MTRDEVDNIIYIFSYILRLLFTYGMLFVRRIFEMIGGGFYAKCMFKHRWSTTSMDFRMLCKETST